MKKIVLFLALSLFTSCSQIRYDGETRLIFTTTVLDGSGNPLRNSHVEIITENEFDSDIISIGKTDANGKIRLIFPSPENDYHINLHLYNDDTGYLEKTINQIPSDNFVNYKFDFPTLHLLKIDEVAPLNLTLNQVSTQTIVKKIGINGIYHTDIEHYYPSDYFDTYPQFLIKKNQAFQLKYVLLNTATNVETEHIVDLQINNDAINYTINY